MRLSFVFAAALMALVLGASTIDLDQLDNYANQTVPAYIQKDNLPANQQMSDAVATLGRVLFYDKELSANGTISCASCHKQAFAFSDTAKQSLGLDGGLTGRHSMRLINARFATEVKFFWDERANSLAEQTTQPIQDHVEMGFSGTNGQPDLDSLIRRLSELPRYKQLFTFVYGDTIVTEARIQEALSQFVRSIQSFDSRFDQGLAQANGNINQNFGNFTAQENQGKQLFLTPPTVGGAGCQGCHLAPEFNIDSASANNGIIATADGTGIDLTNTRAPSLRDIVNPQGVLNGPLMHNGNITNLQQLINHYNAVPQNANNTNLDARLAGAGGQLNLTQAQKDALAAFLATLSGSNVYTDPKWSDPFDGGLSIIQSTAVTQLENALELQPYPNPSRDLVQLDLPEGACQVTIYNMAGQVIQRQETESAQIQLHIADLPAGHYLLEVRQWLKARRGLCRIQKI